MTSYGTSGKWLVILSHLFMLTSILLFEFGFLSATYSFANLLFGFIGVLFGLTATFAEFKKIIGEEETSE